MKSTFASQSAMAKTSSMSFVPHEYQLEAINFMLTHPHGGLFLDPGLGKTSISLFVINHLKKLGKSKKTLLHLAASLPSVPAIVARV